MNFNEAKKRITALAGKASADFTEDDKAFVEQLHIQIYKTRLQDCNCKDKHLDASVKMAIWFKDNKAFNNCHYRIQAGEAFMVGMNYYNNSNLTDEVAEKLLATNPRAQQLITRVELPDDEEEMPVFNKKRKK